jgi:Zn-dependent M28 family amino/carboxypeptidase
VNRAAPALLVAVCGCGTALRMPGRSHEGPLPALTAEQRSCAGKLRTHVEAFAGRIGERTLARRQALRAAEEYLAAELANTGGTALRLEFAAPGGHAANLELTLPGSRLPQEIVVVGAHYDSARGSPGANDNASGVAAALVLARRLSVNSHARTLRVVLFANEEPPYFQTDRMGSLIYARASRKRGDHIVAMLSLETMGYYSDVKGSQKYPAPLGLLFPSRGNFIGFVSNPDSRELLRTTIASFRKHASFPSEGVALAEDRPGIGWSDHWAFWQVGYPAVMVTDTAPFRYPHYHTRSDTPDKLDYERLARVVVGLEAVVRDLLGDASAQPAR